MINVFICYSHLDELLKEKLEAHLITLKRLGLISSWNDRKLVPGQNWETELDKYFLDSDIILLLISSDFIASEYCYNIEMKKAIEFHDANKKVVIPIILRECDWEGTPFEKIQGLPKDMKPIVSRHWHTADEAFLNTIQGVKKQIKDFQSKKTISQTKIETIGEEFDFVSIYNTPYKYVGQISNDKPNGFGRAKFSNGDEYLGNWKNGMMDGKGLYTWKNGDIYFGDWLDHERTGKGYELKEKLATKLMEFKKGKLVISRANKYVCNFCGGERDDRELIVTGANSNICDACIKKAFSILVDQANFTFDLEILKKIKVPKKIML